MDKQLEWAALGHGFGCVNFRIIEWIKLKRAIGWTSQARDARFECVQEGTSTSSSRERDPPPSHLPGREPSVKIK